MQPGDVELTAANTKNLEELISFKPQTTIQDGVRNFIKWYRNYFHV